MKILHIVHQYAPDFVGGTELYTATLATEQAALGHLVSIFVPSRQEPTKGGGSTEKTTEDGIDVYRVKLGSRSANQVFANTIFGSSAITFAFINVLKEVDPDIVHIQHLMGIPTQVTTILTEFNIPYVVTLHDYWYGCANAQLLTNYDQSICAGPNRTYTNCGRCAFARAGKSQVSLIGAPAIAPVMAVRQRKLRKVLGRAKGVIPPTHFVQNAYEKMGFNTANFVHIPHGIELPEDLVSAAKSAAPQKRSALPERLVLAFVGGISPQKGLHTLIEAFNHLPDDATLTIYGDLEKFPDYVVQLRQLISHPAIKLAGRLPHEKVWDVMATADFVAMPTHWFEASPLTIDEVFAVNTSLLASNIGAQTEKIRHGVDGWLVPPGDIEAWREALEMIYADPGLSGRLRANIRPIFPLAMHVERVIELYKT